MQMSRTPRRESMMAEVICALILGLVYIGAEFFWDLYYFVKFVMSPPVNAATHSAIYFAKERWPTYDFANKPITFYPPRTAGNRLIEEAVRGVTI